MNSDMHSVPEVNFNHDINALKFPQVHVEAVQETKLRVPAKYCAYSHF